MPNPREKASTRTSKAFATVKRVDKPDGTAGRLQIELGEESPEFQAGETIKGLASGAQATLDQVQLWIYPPGPYVAGDVVRIQLVRNKRNIASEPDPRGAAQYSLLQPALGVQIGPMGRT